MQNHRQFQYQNQQYQQYYPPVNQFAAQFVHPAGVTVPRSVSSPYYLNRPPPPPASPSPQQQHPPFSPLASPVISQYSTNRHSYHDDSLRATTPRPRSVASVASASGKAPGRYHRRKSLGSSSTPIITTNNNSVSPLPTPSPSSSSSSNSQSTSPVQAAPPSGSGAATSFGSELPSVMPIPELQPPKRPSSSASTSSTPTTLPSQQQQSPTIAPASNKKVDQAQQLQQPPLTRPASAQHHRQQTPKLYKHSGQSNSLSALSKRERERERERERKKGMFANVTITPQSFTNKSFIHLATAKSPPPLVLPSDVRRHSLASFSRSPTSSPSPTHTPSAPLPREHVRSSSFSSLPEPKTSILKSPRSSSASSPSGSQNEANLHYYRSSPSSPSLSHYTSQKRSSKLYSQPPQSHPQQPATQAPPKSINQLPARPSSRNSANSSGSAAPIAHKQAVAQRQQQQNLSKSEVRRPSNLSITTNFNDQPSLQVDQTSNQKLKIGARLRKAFSFGSKKHMQSGNLIDSDRASIVSMPISQRVPNTPDSASIVSTKSTSSSVSFATLRKRVSRGFFNGNKRQVSTPVTSNEHLRREQPPVLAGNVPFAGNSNNHRQSAAAEPIVSHSVAEVEMPKSSASTISSLSTVTVTATAPPSPPPSIHNQQQQERQAPSHHRQTSQNYNSETESDPIPSLTSSTESTTVGDEEPRDHLSDPETDVNAGDTVFPKNLDLLTVENIRSSLERTKSLERRKSKKGSSDKKETIPNPTEIHITDPQECVEQVAQDQAQEHDHDNEKDDETTKSILKAPIIDFDLTDDLDLDFSFDKLRGTSDIAQTVGDESKHSKSSSKSSIASDISSSNGGSIGHSHVNGGATFHYHPLYKNRLSTMVPSHSHSSSASSSSFPGSYHDRSLSASTTDEYKTESRNTVTFSSRIVIYDTYDGSIYDRRAELATCNRLTPTMAQQIKEELNNFKMEMDIHADSRIYTHFF